MCHRTCGERIVRVEHRHRNVRLTGKSRNRGNEPILMKFLSLKQENRTLRSHTAQSVVYKIFEEGTHSVTDTVHGS